MGPELFNRAREDMGPHCMGVLFNGLCNVPCEQLIAIQGVKERYNTRHDVCKLRYIHGHDHTVFSKHFRENLFCVYVYML